MDFHISKGILESTYNIYKNIRVTASKLDKCYSYIRNKLHEYNIPVYNEQSTSAEEQEIAEYVRSLGIDISCNNRKVIPPLELDIVAPNNNLAIEYCGLYWHSQLSGEKVSTYHQNKLQKTEEVGYQLLTIFELDWQKKRPIVESIIASKLGKSTHRIGARQLVVKEVDKSIAHQFFKDNHLMGSVGANIYIGLFKDDQLLSAISISKSRFNKNYQYELARFASKLDYSIPGGFTRMFKYFKEQYQPDSIITYCDLRYGNGKVYLNSGFTQLSSYTTPNYWYFDRKYPTEMLSRIQFQKHKLADKLQYFDSNASEYDNMINNGYDRIHDCGNRSFIWTK